MASAKHKKDARSAELKREGRKPRSERASRRKTLYFTRKNYLILIVGILVIAAGYYLLSKGSITFAPLLLILGYCVIIPIAIIIK